MTDDSLKISPTFSPLIIPTLSSTFLALVLVSVYWSLTLKNFVCLLFTLNDDDVQKVENIFLTTQKKKVADWHAANDSF